MPMQGSGTRLDPVCDTNVQERDVTYKSNYKGRIYYCCSYECMKKFEDNPEKYLKTVSESEV